MRIAVVIPALEEVSSIEGAIRSARAPAVEIVVADGGSRDGTPERARAAGARVVSSPPGRARQLEAGWRATAAEAVLFLHADTRLPEGWDAAVRGALEDPRVAGGAFGLRFDDRGVALRLVEWGVRMRLALVRLPYGDQGIFARRRALEALGGVPQQPILEDVDLVRGLRRHGRLALLRPAVQTSARRYRRRGVWRGVARNAGILLADALGRDRSRLAEWYRR